MCSHTGTSLNGPQKLLLDVTSRYLFAACPVETFIHCSKPLPPPTCLQDFTRERRVAEGVHKEFFAVPLRVLHGAQSAVPAPSCGGKEGVLRDCWEAGEAHAHRGRGGDVGIQEHDAGCAGEPE